MAGPEPQWFARLSEAGRRRAREWSRADPKAFAEIVQAEKRGRPRSSLGPDAAFASMAQMITADPHMAPFTAARLSAHLVPGAAVSRTVAMRLARQWQQVSSRYLRDEGRRRRENDRTSLALYGVTGVAALEKTDPELAAAIRAIEAHTASVRLMEKQYTPDAEGVGVARSARSPFMPSGIIPDGGRD